jgi:hypothetical protein
MDDHDSEIAVANIIKIAADNAAMNLILSKELEKMNARLDEISGRLARIAEWRPSTPKEGDE